MVELLTLATRSTVRRAQGFVSAALHRSLDGAKVAMYSQWRSLEDYERLRGDPEASAYLLQAFAIAKSDLAMYEVVETFCPSGTEGG